VNQPTHAGPVARGLIFMVRLYQGTLSPILGRQCRFIPTCSEYFIEAVTCRGAVVGSLLGLWRLMRCNPLCRGGFDPVRRQPRMRRRNCLDRRPLAR